MPPHSNFEQCADDGNFSCAPRATKPKRKKSIRLRMEQNEVFPIPHIDDFDEEVIQAIWYQQDEYATMKVGFVATIKKMMRGEHIPENNESTIRGLEFRTRKGALRRQHNKLTAITAVLDEQDRQFSEGIFDEDTLSETYLAHSTHCRDSAHAIGKKDVVAIKEFMAEVSAPTENRTVGEIMTFRRNKTTTVEPSRKTEKKQLAIQKMFKQSRIRRRTLLDMPNEPPQLRIETPTAA